MKKEIAYLALGDSYTIGESVDPAERYPVQIFDSLSILGFHIQVPQIIAKTGWTTSELIGALDTAITHPPYDLVTLLIGVNNQYRGLDVEIYRKEFTVLLKKSIDYSGGDKNSVIVISIPDWGVTPFASNRDKKKIASEIDNYNVINKDLSSELGVHYVDITGISRMAESDKELLATDGLHPSGTMYNKWIEEIIPLAREILK